MATTHLKDIVAVTGTYERDGQTKKQYRNVGKLLRNDKGDFLVIDRTFNPAGCPGDGDVFLSLFEPKAQPRKSPQAATSNVFDTDGIPF